MTIDEICMGFPADIANHLMHENSYAGWKVVARRNDGGDRWYSYHSAVITHDKLNDGFIAFNYELPLTELQENIYFDVYSYVEAYQVFPREQTVVVYEEKE